MRYGFFFLNDFEGQPRVTVCMAIHGKLFTNDARIGIGVAICGPGEIPDIEFGIQTAMRRAYRIGLTEKRTAQPINNMTALVALKMCNRHVAGIHVPDFPSQTPDPIQFIGVKQANLTVSKIRNQKWIGDNFEKALDVFLANDQFEYSIISPSRTVHRGDNLHKLILLIKKQDEFKKIEIKSPAEHECSFTPKCGKIQFHPEREKYEIGRIIHEIDALRAELKNQIRGVGDLQIKLVEKLSQIS